MTLNDILAQIPEGVFSDEDKNFLSEKTKSAYAFNKQLQKKYNCSQSEADRLLNIFVMTRIESFLREMVDSNDYDKEGQIIDKMISLSGEFAIKEGLSENEANELKKDSLDIINFFKSKGLIKW